MPERTSIKWRGRERETAGGGGWRDLWSRESSWKGKLREREPVKENEGERGKKFNLLKILQIAPVYNSFKLPANQPRVPIMLPSNLDTMVVNVSVSVETPEETHCCQPSCKAQNDRGMVEGVRKLMFYSAGSLNCHLTRQSGGQLSGYGDKRNCPFGFQPVATELDAEIKHEEEEGIDGGDVLVLDENDKEDRQGQRQTLIFRRDVPYCVSKPG